MREIVALSRLDDAANLGIVYAVGGAATVDEMVKRDRGIVELRVAWKTGLVEHQWTRSVYRWVSRPAFSVTVRIR